jgi:chromosome partitioning protein
MEKGYIQISELSEILGGVSPQAIYKMLNTKDLESIKITPRKRVVTPSTMRSIFEEKGYIYKQQIIAFDMIKGGVGKTTLSSNLALRSSHYGCRTLLIDFDLQGNLTRSFNISTDPNKMWINIVRDGIDVRDTIVGISPFLDIIPSGLSNSRLDFELKDNGTNLPAHVRDVISPIYDNYDLIIIDCPPAINQVSSAAMMASDFVVIPLNPDPYSMDGLEMTKSEIERLKKNWKLDNPKFLAVWNKYDARKRLGAFYMHDIAKRIDVEHIIPVVIRNDSSYEKAIAAKEGSIFESTRNNPAKDDIDQLTKEILGINKWLDSNDFSVTK